MEVNVRSRLLLGETGDRAKVSRIIRSGNRLYVDVEQTKDAREPTVIVAVNAALERYEKDNNISLE